jgi:hypothetical protein
MKRHLIAGRLGPDDVIKIPAADDELVTRLDLVTSNTWLDHGIGDALDSMAKFGVFPTEIGLDLLVLAAHVHAADTRIARLTESQDSWTREIRLVVPVSSLPTWLNTVPVLQRMLDFLTGDRWIVGFRERPPRFTSAVRPKPLVAAQHPFNELSLFSGGLDSLIGTIDLLEQGRVPLLVSHAGEGATSNAQNSLFEKLKKHYDKIAFNRLRLWMNFSKGLVADSGSEDTTRGRSFLFIASGAFAGTGLSGSFTLRVPENGLIALNVPLDPLRLGSLSTRTTHPFYMARWNELFETLGIEGRVENPYWDKTKGEMVADCRNRALLTTLVPLSLSCSSPTKGRWQGHGTQHCGYCLPCLIRRAAVRKGLGADPTPYTVSNLAQNVLDTRQAEGQQVRSFQFAIARLQERPELASILIHKPGPLRDQTMEQKEQLAAVYRRGLDEVAVLLANVQTKPL